MSLAPTVPPGEAALAEITARARWVVPLVRTALHPFVPIDVVGAESFPREGPCLVLANHVANLDPLLISLAVRRPVQWLTTESLLEGPLGHVLAPWGVIPKKKFTADPRALHQLVRWARCGAAVGIFPEGQRTWDGRPLPLLPGIERLVPRLAVPLVTVRLVNIDRQWPRWAAAPRFGRVRVEVDAPVETRGLAPEAVSSLLEARLRVDPERCVRYPMRGVRLAQGVSNVLFACPACLRLEGLRERGDEARCVACGEAWRVDTENRLHGRAGPIALTEAVDLVRAGVAAAGMRDPRAGDALLTSEPCVLWDRTDPEPVRIAEGPLRLRPDGLSVGDWHLPMEALASVSAEQRRRLWLRTSDRLYEPVLRRESTCKWEWMTEHWRRAAVAAA